MGVKKRYALTALALLLSFSVAASAGQSKKSSTKSKKSTTAKTTSKAKPATKTSEAKPATEAKPAEEQEIERITVDELKEKLAKSEPVFIIDSRSQGSYDSSDTKIRGAVRMPSSEIEARLKEIPRGEEIVIYCT